MTIDDAVKLLSTDMKEYTPEAEKERYAFLMAFADELDSTTGAEELRRLCGRACGLAPQPMYKVDNHTCVETDEIFRYDWNTPRVDNNGHRGSVLPQKTYKNLIGQAMKWQEYRSQSLRLMQPSYIWALELCDSWKLLLHSLNEFPEKHGRKR